LYHNSGSQPQKKRSLDIARNAKGPVRQIARELLDMKLGPGRFDGALDVAERGSEKELPLHVAIVVNGLDYFYRFRFVNRFHR
jgi:hypothetical protein